MLKNPDAVVMARVEIQRVSGGYTEHLYPFEIVIDGEVVGQLGRGESEAVDVSPGSHEVFVRLFWCRSERVDVHLEEGEKVSFRCDTRAKFFTDVYWATRKRNRYLRLTQIGSQGGTRFPHGGEKVVSTPSRLPGRPTPPSGRSSSVGSTIGAWSRLARLRRGRPVVMGTVLAGVILAAVVSLTLALTWGLDFLASISVIYIAARVVTALVFHLFVLRSDLKSNVPFVSRTQEAIISAAFALAGFAALAGALDAGNLGGWLALIAAAVAAANVMVAR